MKSHKQGCLANTSCLVIHPDGICPGPYGKCTCDVIDHSIGCICEKCYPYEAKRKDNSNFAI